MSRPSNARTKGKNPLERKLDTTTVCITTHNVALASILFPSTLVIPDPPAAQSEPSPEALTTESLGVRAILVHECFECGHDVDSARIRGTPCWLMAGIVAKMPANQIIVTDAKTNRTSTVFRIGWDVHVGYMCKKCMLATGRLVSKFQKECNSVWDLPMFGHTTAAIRLVACISDILAQLVATIPAIDTTSTLPRNLLGTVGELWLTPKYHAIETAFQVDPCALPHIPDNDMSHLLFGRLFRTIDSVSETCATMGCSNIPIYINGKSSSLIPRHWVVVSTWFAFPKGLSIKPILAKFCSSECCNEFCRAHLGNGHTLASNPAFAPLVHIIDMLCSNEHNKQHRVRFDQQSVQKFSKFVLRDGECL